MKCAVLYMSKTGTTKKMAEKIVEGMLSVENVQAKAFDLGEIDEEWVKESDCVVIGSPTYYTDIAAEAHVFLETLGKYNVAGKLGGAFATAAYIHGGADIALESILEHEMFFGMMVYSGGGARGKPPIHLGPVYVNETCEPIFADYGARIAKQAAKIF